MESHLLLSESAHYLFIYVPHHHHLPRVSSVTAKTLAGSSPCIPVPITVTGIEQILSKQLLNGYMCYSLGNLRDNGTANPALSVQAW